MRMGDMTRSPRLAKPREVAALPVRAAIVDDGAEFEVVWYPHRDAAPLLSDEYPTIIGGRYSDSTDLHRVLRQTFGVQHGERD